MAPKINVVILDDHQPIIDGYLFRLNQASDIRVVDTLFYYQDLEPVLAREKVDVLLLDLQVPISPDNPNSYPVLHELPRLIQEYPRLEILIISMHAQPALIQALLEAGASGYILKEDMATFRELANVIRSVAGQGIYISQAAYQALGKRKNSAYSQPLSARQLEVLSLCAAYPDLSTAELALKMDISHSTVRNLLSGAYLKLNVRNRTAALLRAQQLGLII
ncbi:MAG: response regulator transcription factor [Anaerolineales bacterium]|nr:response regulator transcription factor [Anaerolineales bacterium]